MTNGCANLLPIENDDPQVGGFVVEFPSGDMKTVQWREDAPVLDPRLAAKSLVTQMVDVMLKQGDQSRDDLNRTNIPSLVASVEKLILDWNEKTRARLYAQAPAVLQ